MEKGINAMLRVEMLSTGDEVLHGSIIDTNAAWLSDYLFQHGLPMATRTTVGDNLSELVDTLKLRSQFANILIVNGGLGPTSDDLSAEAAALALDTPLELRSEWVETMKLWFAQKGRVMAESNVKQAMLPKDVRLINNPVGSACGFQIELNGCLIFFTPGVPSEFKVMVQQSILPILQEKLVLPKPLVCLRLTSFGRSESQLAQLLQYIPLPTGVELGYRSASPIIEIKLTGPADKKEAMQEAWQKIESVINKNIIYEGNQTSFADIVAGQLRHKELTITVSEHFTAGLVHLQLARAKANLIGGQFFDNSESLSLVLLLKEAQNTRQQCESDIALVIGKMETQFINIAIATCQGGRAIRFQYNGYGYDVEIQQQTIAMLALDQLRHWLNGEEQSAHYEWIDVIESYNSYL